MKNWHIFKKLILMVLILAVIFSFASTKVSAKDDDWLSYPDGSLPFPWSQPGMASWNLEFDLTKAESGEELARKTLSSKYQSTDLTVVYAVPKVNRELWELLNKYNMELLLTTCLEVNPDKEWHDKGPDAVCYCYALDDPNARHIKVHFYDDVGRLYGLSEELITPEAGDYDAWSSDNPIDYYAFNFACDCYQSYEEPDEENSWRHGPYVSWARLDQSWGHSIAWTDYEYGSIYASPHSLRVTDKEALKEMEKYIIEFREARGLPEL